MTLTYSPAGPYTAGDTVIVTATLLDGGGSPVSGQTLTLTTNPSDSTVELVTSGGLVTDANGKVTATIKSTSVQPVTISASATVNGQTVTGVAPAGDLVFNAGATPTLTLASTPAGPHTAGDTVTVTATLLDGGGSPISGQTLTLGTDPSDGTVVLDTSGGLATDANGKVTATVKSTSAQTVKVTAGATVSGNTVNATAVDLVFNAGTTPTLTLASTPAGPHTAGDTVNVTATLLDGGGSPISGQTLTLGTDPSGGTVVLDTSGGLVTDASGKVTATVKSTSAQTVKVTASAMVSGNTVNATAVDLVFNAGATPTLTLASATAGPYTVAARSR